MENNYATNSPEQQLIEFVTSHLKNYQQNPPLFERELSETRNKILRALNNEEILRAIQDQLPLRLYDNSLVEGVYIKRRKEKFERSVFPFEGTGPQKKKSADQPSMKKYYIMKDQNSRPQYLLRTYWIEEPIGEKDKWMELILVYQGEPKRDQKKKGSSNFNDISHDNIIFPNSMSELTGGAEEAYNM